MLTKNGDTAGLNLEISMSDEKIVLGHGSGGKLSQELFQQVFWPRFQNPYLDQVHDGAVLTINGQRIAFTTDSYVVKPLFFPGGNIGDLAINGTVNDIAMCGARPLYLSAGFILEEGFELDRLDRIVESMRQAAYKAGVWLVTGDTKVVEKGGADGVFINTAGIGSVLGSADISPRNVREGHVVILSGRIADHGIAILSEREGINFETEIRSDTAPLNAMVEKILSVSNGIRMMRDPTRGGLAAALNEIASAAAVGMRIDEERIPIADAVRAAGEMLGLDPMSIANEGKMVVILEDTDAEKVLAAMRSVPEGIDSAIIGRTVAEHRGRVVMRTRIGTHRIVEMPTGEQLPRIC
jgi:hydrogenase expression/formation protein HypE